MTPILYSFRRCPYAMRARMALILASKECELREILLKDKPDEMLKVSSKGTVPVLQFTNKVLDESLDIISWAMESPAPNVHIYSEAEESLALELVQLFDSSTKETVYANVARTDKSDSASTSKVKISFASAPSNDIEVIITSATAGKTGSVVYA